MHFKFRKLMKSIIALCFAIVVFSSTLYSQNVGQKGDSLVNYKDINGLKQGLWKKQYKSGKTAYVAHFKNDKLIGNYKRFYKGGKLSLEVNYEDNESGAAKIYYDNKILGAEGRYVNRNVKDGLWKYYGSDGRIVIQLTYANGIQEGQEIKFWKNGQKMEEKNWMNGQEDGLWAQWFENGKQKLKTRMIKGKRSGVYYGYYPNGGYYVKGWYKDDLRVKEWTFYDTKGNTTRDTEYTNGVAADQDKIDVETTKKINEWEQMKGEIPDPSLDNMFKYDKVYGPKSK